MVPFAAEVKKSGISFLLANANFYFVIPGLTYNIIVVYLFIEFTINFICDKNTGYFGTMFPHLVIPLFKIFIGDLSGNVKN